MQFHTRALDLTLLAFCLLADIPSWSWRYWVSQFAGVETILLACVLKGHFHLLTSLKLQRVNAIYIIYAKHRFKSLKAQNSRAAY